MTGRERDRTLIPVSREVQDLLTKLKLLVSEATGKKFREVTYDDVIMYLVERAGVSKYLQVFEELRTERREA